MDRRVEVHWAAVLAAVEWQQLAPPNTSFVSQHTWTWQQLQRHHLQQQQGPALPSKNASSTYSVHYPVQNLPVFLLHCLNPSSAA
jgi:hypothetical protein